MEPTRLYKVSEIAEIIGCGRSLAWSLVLKGEIESILVSPRCRRVPAHCFQKWVDRKVAAQQSTV